MKSLNICPSCKAMLAFDRAVLSVAFAADSRIMRQS